MKRAMQKRRSISFMAWVTVLTIIAIGAAVKAVPLKMTEAQFKRQMEEAIQQDREAQTLANALFAEARYRAREVGK